jgi:hypothetical protein
MGRTFAFPERLSARLIAHVHTSALSDISGFRYGVIPSLFWVVIRR